MAPRHCGQLRHVIRVCLSIRCELNGCYDGARDHVHLFCDRVVEMVHMHACLQEEEEGGSIEETIASFL